jgi:16S rRNA (uracil1498-N3)-methyltransferase
MCKFVYQKLFIMHLFYLPALNEAELDRKFVELPEEEARHAIKVLRLRQGTEIQITNGKGLWVSAVVAAINKRQCVAEIKHYETEVAKRDFRIHIAVAPTKNIKRFEWFLEKATEIGIDEITPIISFHSERREIKVDRENKVITAAMKQSLKAWHPVLNEPVRFKDFIQRKTDEELFIAHLIDEHQLLLKDVAKPSSSVCVLVGPEGDFSTEEVEQALAAGYRAVSLGNTRLRTETAALVSCFTINLLNL